MRIVWYWSGVLLAASAALANNWLTNELAIVAKVQSALPAGLKTTHTGYGNGFFHGIQHFFILIIDNSGSNPTIRINYQSDAEILLLPPDYDYTSMQNSDELDRFLVAANQNFKALFLAPETLDLLWAETRKNLKFALSGLKNQDTQLTPQTIEAQIDVSKKWRTIEKRILSLTYPKIELKNASINDVIKFIYTIESKIIEPKTKRNLPLLFSKHIYGTQLVKVTLHRQNIQMFEILDAVCIQSDLNWKISQNIILIYDNTEQASERVQLTINRHRREETNYLGQGAIKQIEDTSSEQKK